MALPPPPLPLPLLDNANDSVTSLAGVAPT